jgi:F-box interacting protein
MIEVAEHEDEYLFNGGMDCLYSLSGKRFDNIVQIYGPNTINFGIDDDDDHDDDDNGFKFVYPVSRNGTLDLKHDDFYGKKKLVVWRPAADLLKYKIPSPENNPFWKFWAHHFQVGYDHVKDDYKMIRCTHYSCGMISGHFWEMYSQSKNSWKKIDVDMPHSRWSRETVYMDGVFHWWDKNETHPYLVSFDFCKESFITTPIPLDDSIPVDHSFDSMFVRRHLTVINGFIATMLNDKNTSTLHVSILCELGVKESWTKLFIVGLLPCLDHPIGPGKKTNILFRKKDGKLAWFDLSTEIIYEIDITITTQTNDYKILFHKESLPIGGIHTNFTSCFLPRDL